MALEVAAAAAPKRVGRKFYAHPSSVTMRSATPYPCGVRRRGDRLLQRDGLAGVIDRGAPRQIMDQTTHEARTPATRERPSNQQAIYLFKQPVFR